VDFARETVTVRWQWNEREVVLNVMDDGAGFSAEILDRIGEPYMTRRPLGTARGGLGSRPVHRQDPARTIRCLDHLRQCRRAGGWRHRYGPLAARKLPRTGRVRTAGLLSGLENARDLL
jgi:hypothetical protein